MTYTSEAALCAAFISDIKDLGFTVYPETGSWDMILERRGFMIGVQAKLRLDYHALRQAVSSDGVDLKIVLFDLLPERKPAAKARWLEDWIVIAKECKILGVKTVDIEHTRDDVPNHPAWQFAGREGNWYWNRNKSKWEMVKYLYKGNPTWLSKYLHYPVKRAWLPPYPSNAIAGAAAPRSISPFQIAAVKLEQLCNEKGWVSIYDAREITKKEKGSWNPRSLLRGFTTNGQKIPAELNQKGSQWELEKYKRSWPSERYPQAIASIGITNK